MRRKVLLLKQIQRKGKCKKRQSQQNSGQEKTQFIVKTKKKKLEIKCVTDTTPKLIIPADL